MIEKFQGKDGRPALLAALRSQFLVDGSVELAERIASDMQLKEYSEGSAIYTQGERGGDMCLILAGKVAIRVDDEQVAMVNAGMHVGEIGMLEPFKGRSASVVAMDTVVAAHILQKRFREMAKPFPDLWYRLALELAHRLVNAQTKG